jgi:hypothetical protein
MRPALDSDTVQPERADICATGQQLVVPVSGSAVVET